MSRKAEYSSETSKEVFPTRLRALMEREPKTTQPQLAAALGIQRQTVSNYANGQSSPDWKTLAKIADHFGVSVDWLLGRTDTESPDADMQAVCSYTGLSEDTVKLLKIVESLSHVLNTLSTPEEGEKFYNTPLCLFSQAFAQLEMETGKAAVALYSNEIKNSVDASLKRDAIELAVFRFSEVCRKLPDKLLSNSVITLLDDMVRDYYAKEFQQYLAEKRNGGGNDGEH